MSESSYNQTAYVAIGSNGFDKLAETKSVLDQSLAELAKKTTVGDVSPIYSTPCFPAGAGPDYLNAVASLQTALDPAALLTQLHRIENTFGRIRATRWGQRTLDLDLLAVGDMILPHQNGALAWMDLPLDQQMTQAPSELILPHPRIQDRSFVLGPWKDIAPQWRHPILGQSVQQMWDALPAEDRASIKPI